MIISIPGPNWIKKTLLIWIEFQFAKIWASQLLPSNVWIERLMRPIVCSSQVIKFFLKSINYFLLQEKRMLYMPTKSWNARSTWGLNYGALISSQQNANASAWLQQAIQLHEFGLQGTQAFIFISKVIDSGKLPLIKLHHFLRPVIWAQTNYLINDIEQKEKHSLSLISFPSSQNCTWRSSAVWRGAVGPGLIWFCIAT